MVAVVSCMGDARPMSYLQTLLCPTLTCDFISQPTSTPSDTETSECLCHLFAFQFCTAAELNIRPCAAFDCFPSCFAILASADCVRNQDPCPSGRLPSCWYAKFDPQIPLQFNHPVEPCATVPDRFGAGLRSIFRYPYGLPYHIAVSVTPINGSCVIPGLLGSRKILPSGSLY